MQRRVVPVPLALSRGFLSVHHLHGSSLLVSRHPASTQPSASFSTSLTDDGKKILKRGARRRAESSRRAAPAAAAPAEVVTAVPLQSLAPASPAETTSSRPGGGRGRLGPARGGRTRDGSSSTGTGSTGSGRYGSVSSRSRLHTTSIPTEGDLELVHGQWLDPFVVINKPFGLALQSLSEDSVENRLMRLYNKYDIYFPHRLDKHTGGLLVVAFDRTTAAALCVSLQKKKWMKRYRVLAEVPPCVIDQYIATKPSSSSSNSSSRNGSSSEPLVIGSSSSASSSASSSSSSDSSSSDATPPPKRHTSHLIVSRHVKGGFIDTELNLLREGEVRSYLRRRYHDRTLFTPHDDDDDPELSATLSASRGEVLADRTTAAVNAEIELSKHAQSLLRCGCQRPHFPHKPPPPPDTGKNKAKNSNMDKEEEEPPVRIPFLHPLVPQGMLYESVSPTQTQIRSTQRHNRPLEGDAASAFGGKQAITRYWLRQLLPERKLAMYDVYLVTGRTHQLRVHFAEAGFSIYRDPYYNTKYIAAWITRLLTTKATATNATPMAASKKTDHNMALQAHYISFPDPTRTHTGKTRADRLLTLALPVPEHWQHLGFRDMKATRAQEAKMRRAFGQSRFLKQQNHLQRKAAWTEQKYQRYADRIVSKAAKESAAAS